jgi:hypothetical protein
MSRALVVTAAALAVIAVASFSFTYVAINAICDDDYWPDWA